MREYEPRYKTVEEFNEAYNFAQKAGFTLAPMQVEDIESCVMWRACLNTSEVGCGKTVEATAVSLMRGVDCSIVMLPPILIMPWVRWLKKLGEDAIAYQGTPAERKQLSMDHRWLVMSYAIFRIDYRRIMESVESKRFELVVDEAQNIKNIQSKLYKLIKVAFESAPEDAFLQMLTGTPLSKPLDAYAYISLKTPKLYYSNLHFENMHVLKRDMWEVPIAYQNLDVMKSNLAINSVSRTKKEMHGYDLQPIFPDCTYELDPAHMKLYRKMVDEQLLIFEDGTKIDLTTPQKLQHALQQVVANWGAFARDPTKIAAIYELLDQSLEETQCATRGNSKLIIWTKYKLTSAAMLKYCNDLGIRTVAAYGDANSGKSVDLFMEDESTRILVAQYQSAGAGLNPQHVCSEALHVEFDTVPMYMRQSFGRIDRMGQTVRPRMKIAMAAGTVQVHMMKQLLAKDDLIARVEPTKEGLRKMLLGL